LEKVRNERDNDTVKRQLRRLKETAKSDENLYPAVLEAVESYATVGEVCDVLRKCLVSIKKKPFIFSGDLIRSKLWSETW
jgi:methylmalonyl-CoA mutase N-terminal domain/subunit